LTYPLYLTHDMTMSALFGLWGLVGVPGMTFVNFARSFTSPYTTGVVLFALLAIACLLVALIVHVLVELPLRFVPCGYARLATAGHGGACGSTGGGGAGGERKLATPG
jgi:peptidoglycan/LPS O-acetylase OafA/YrhL